VHTGGEDTLICRGLDRRADEPQARPFVDHRPA
jgi:hypothetical protein